jgi:hypothetical protein
MKKLAALTILAALSCTAHAQSIFDEARPHSFFQIEAGAGAAYGQTLNDGVWYQQGEPTSRLHNKTPVFMLGLTGDLYRTHGVDFRYHADYVYIGSQSASCMCVDDDNYNPYTHRVLNAQGTHTAFNGQGHVQGIAATLDVGYMITDQWRIGAEAGPFLYWETWHEHAAPGGVWGDYSHRTVFQRSWVVGANVSRGPFSLSYRYYNLPQYWNPSPALLRAAHTVTLNYRY